MKVLKLILILAGIALIAFGLYNAFVPQKVVEVGPLAVSAKEGLTNQTVAMIILGVLALLAGIYIKKR